ncbi:hypothetical protein GCK32_019251 [Trichostrongylus colubriformis]|uniref:Uncharacterized protein n=1 Tax=Trichostrongylus colubriformis TaxID=6319 RepID=A0AAN8FYN4_TRICO
MYPYPVWNNSGTTNENQALIFPGSIVLWVRIIAAVVVFLVLAIAILIYVKYLCHRNRASGQSEGDSAGKDITNDNEQEGAENQKDGDEVE